MESLAPPRPRVLVLEGSADGVADVLCLLAADGWPVEALGAEAPPAIEAGTDLPIVLLHLDGLGTATPLVLQCLRHVAPELPVIALAGGRGPRREVVRALGLHGLYDPKEDPERLLELLDSAAGLLARLRRTKDEQELQTLLVSKLCHDLRGALHALRGYAEMLEMDGPAVDFDVVRGRIDDVSRRALEIASGYLDLARLGGANDDSRDSVGVDALLSDLLETATSRAAGRAIQVFAENAAPGTVIRTNERKLRAVLGELVSNAVKFTSAGRVRLTADSGPGYAEFRVADDGPGVDGLLLRAGVAASEQARQFLLTPTPGQGIGLALAVRLTEQLGGSLTVEPGAAGGTAVRLLLPEPGSPLMAMSSNVYH